ncbi:carboxylesterase/lipase family protein [Novosphingobium rosa]|uniref:carboxylesterase/lipase family protein n=1 Tax=Novosphingobium rosa TaxID=76978 RepID=UPI000A034CC1|nr:carboxylesterase family protein [Novosphingobium rosa]
MNRMVTTQTRRKRLATSASLWLCLFSTSLQAQVLEAVSPVQTTSGAVAGAVLEGGVKAWLGIPFAKPPLYDLRWQPPQPIRWNGVYNADRKMPECMQVLRPHDINNYFGEEPTSENCLYLNIWAPPGSKPAEKHPVVVFIYGGGSTIGSAGSPMYDGADLAKKGVVYVTIAYRLGILGWMAHPELTKEQGGHSGNYGYLDQSFALRWVHDNIARFGGDAERITIAGQSAGAGSVSAQMHSPLSKGLFSGAFMSSTCSIGTGTLPSLADGEKVGLEIQKRLGANSLEDLRYIAADQLIRLQAETQVGYSNTGGVKATPVLDGYFFTQEKPEAASSHAMSDVPVLANFNSGESAGLFYTAHTVEQYRDLARTYYGEKADAFLKLYPVRSDADVAPTAAKIAREAAIAYNSRQCGVIQAKYNKSPVYISMYDRKHPYAPGVRVGDQDPATIGAYHNADIIYWFDNLDVFNAIRHTRDWTATDRTLASTMSDALVAFAADRDPSTPALRWPAWSVKNDGFMRFAAKTQFEPFNTRAMAWLAANKPGAAALPGGGGMGAPGMISGKGPRD